MSTDLNFKRVGQTHLFQSDSYLINKEELKYIFENRMVKGGDIESMINNHQTIPLDQGSDRRVKFCFWQVNGTDDEWVFDVVKPKDAFLELPPRLSELLASKKPIPKKDGNSDKWKSDEQENDSPMKKAKVWITYAWDDNEDKDVNFIAQELKEEGLEVRLVLSQR